MENDTQIHDDHYRLLKETPRSWQIMKDQAGLINLIEEKLGRRPLYLKGTIPPAEFTPAERSGEGFVFYYNPSIQLSPANTLYITLNRHLEIDFRLGEVLSPGKAVLIPEVARVGSIQRAFPRYSLKNGEVVATNFRIATNEISPNNTKLQITTQIIFPEFEKTHQIDYPGLQVLLSSDSRLPKELANQPIEKPTSMSISGIESYIQPVFGQSAKGNVLLAILIFKIPLIGLTDEFKVKSEDLAEELLQKIIDANATLVKDRQKVLDISEGGLALQIDSDILKKNLPLRDWLTFDLIFKMYAPIRFYGNVRHIRKNNGDWFAGIDLSGQGHSDYRKGAKEVYRSLIQKLLKS
ncbi:MAG: hypothetical protein H3C43_10655 [Leptonema sp. (in: Bacteria)]|nr:hypothetical protein [Leptonema sp. (in: bacteria)]